MSLFADELTEDFFNRLELFMAGGERKFMSDSHKMGSPKAVMNPFLFELTRRSIFFALHGIYAHAKLGCVYFNQADNR